MIATLSVQTQRLKTIPEDSPINFEDDTCFSVEKTDFHQVSQRLIDASFRESLGISGNKLRNPKTLIESLDQKISGSKKLSDTEKAKLRQGCHLNQFHSFFKKENQSEIEEQVKTFFFPPTGNTVLNNWTKGSLNYPKDHEIINCCIQLDGCFSIDQFQNLIFRLISLKINDESNFQTIDGDKLLETLSSMVTIIDTPYILKFLELEPEELPKHLKLPNRSHRLNNLIQGYNKEGCNQEDQFFGIKKRIREWFVNPTDFIRSKGREIVAELLVNFQPIQPQLDAKGLPDMPEQVTLETSHLTHSIGDFPNEKWVGTFITSHQFVLKVGGHSDAVHVELPKHFYYSKFLGSLKDLFLYKELKDVFDKISAELVHAGLATKKDTMVDCYEILDGISDEMAYKFCSFFERELTEVEYQKFSRVVMESLMKKYTVLGIGANGNNDLQDTLESSIAIRVEDQDLANRFCKTAYHRQATVEGRMNALDAMPHGFKTFAGDFMRVMTREETMKKALVDAIVDNTISDYFQHPFESPSKKYPLYTRKVVNVESGKPVYQYEKSEEGLYYFNSKKEKFEPTPYILKKDGHIEHNGSPSSDVTRDNASASFSEKEDPNWMKGDLDEQGQFYESKDGQYLKRRRCSDSEPILRGKGFLPQNFEKFLSDKSEWCSSFVQRMFLSSYLYLHFPGLSKAVEDVQLHLIRFSSHGVIQTEESTAILVKAFADQIAERLASETIDSGESMMTSFFQIAPRELRSIKEVTPEGHMRVLTGRSTGPVDCIWRRSEYSGKAFPSWTSFESNFYSQVGVCVGHFAVQTIQLGSDLVAAGPNLLSTPTSSACDAIKTNKIKTKLGMTPKRNHPGAKAFVQSMVNYLLPIKRVTTWIRTRFAPQTPTLGTPPKRV